MGNFWPTFPFVIPNSPGIPLWWDLFWWIFQIVLISSLLYVLKTWCVKMDRMSDEEEEVVELGKDVTIGQHTQLPL
ncbi:hypothetical protein LSG31_18435 [Fodinisporobacter ferrooxydans]|uniref:Uncharacterized protein n=1 Tax=Fodinisporobacter ferrooxydans TaxID=2901836 RepID=A0ABY4CHJ2_9BACL|nr:hypothetical protein LSG31_18435 [Alicyclobacillaceae bacterium MYW30-H2]